MAQIDVAEKIDVVELDLTHSHLWDDSAIGALDKLEMKFAQNGVSVKFKGLNDESSKLLSKIGGLSN